MGHTPQGTRRGQIDVATPGRPASQQRLGPLAAAPAILPGDTAGVCLHELFEVHAAASPTSVAIEAPDRVLAYRELNAAANVAARSLRRAGVGAEQLVGLYGSVSPDLVVGALAVLKAGAAFVPLDPADPRERTRTIIRESRPALVLTTDEHVQAAAALGPEVRTIDRVADADDAANLGRTCNDGDLAYVLFTSGSTGRPKGVMIEHRSIVNYVLWVARTYRIGGTVPLLPTVTRFAFDASLLQTLAPLARGDRVWIVRRSTAEDPAALLAALRSRPGAGLHCTPTLWDEILMRLEGEGSAGGVLELSALLLGGEAVRTDLWSRTRERLPRTALANVYGPTETTVQVSGGFQPRGVPLNVGRAIDGVVLYVLDARLQALEIGAVGEVYVGGTAVGRGYLGRPDLTAERFLPDPFSVDGRDRLYRTSDAGVWSPDGRLQILGRLDEQVKIRGFRVEPEEIESWLRRHETVRAAAVVAVAPQSAAARLRAAVVPHPGATVEPGTLRDHLSRRLPEYMVPSEIVEYRELPRTPNGKVDRRRIAADEHERPRPSTPARRRSPVEEAVGAIWSEVLQLGDVVADDDFFAIGGHSLLAMRIVARTRKAFGVDLPLRMLFDTPTLGAFARQVEELVGGAPEPVPRLARAPVGAPAPLSLQQSELYPGARLLAGTPFGNVLLPVRIVGSLDVDALRLSVSELVGRHAALRTVFRDEGGVPFQVVRSPAPLQLHEEDLRELEPDRRGREARRFARAAYSQSFDLAEGPLVRSRLLRLDAAEWLLLVCVHHIVCDGVSLRRLLDDLVNLYDAHARRVPAPPRSGELDYADFAAWQHRRWREGEYRPVLDYWLRELAGDLEPLRLGTEPPPGERGQRFGTRKAVIAPRLRSALDSFSRDHGVTPFMTLCAALGVVLHAWTGARDLRIGTLAANSERAEFEEVVGLFVNTVVLRIGLDAGWTFDALLDRVRETALRAYAHQALPLELVAASLERKRGVRAGDLFQVGFALEPEWQPHILPTASFEIAELEPTETRALVLPPSCPLTLLARASAGGLDVLADHDERVLDAATTDRLLAGFVATLERVTAEHVLSVAALAESLRA